VGQSDTIKGRAKQTCEVPATAQFGTQLSVSFLYTRSLKYISTEFYILPTILNGCKNVFLILGRNICEKVLRIFGQRRLEVAAQCIKDA
jgi:hypothetical protein